MEDGFKHLLVGFILLGAFMYLLLVFATSVAQDNGKDTTDFEQGAFNLTPYGNFLNDVESNTDQIRTERFAKQNLFITVGDIIVSGFFNIALSLIFIILTPFTLYSQVMVNVLGIPLIIINVISAIIIISIMMGIWSLIRIGN